MRAPDLRRPGRRLRIARAGLLCAFVILAARAGHLSVVDNQGRVRGEKQIVSSLDLRPARGLIVDRHGRELGLSIGSPSVYAVPTAVEDATATARALASALGRDAARLEKRLRRTGRFVFLARWIDPAAARRVRELQLPGIGLLDEPRREYPAGAFAGQVLGFANIDGVGVRGIEEQEDDWLRGRPRRLPVERDARGRLLIAEGIDPHATAGGDVMLTIDAMMQAHAESALADTVSATGATGGLVVSLDPRTGEILALAEQPGFDPNEFRSVPFPESRSRVFLDSLEPGSILKVFTLAAALAHGVVSPSDVVDCEEDGAYAIPGKTVRDRRPFGLQTVGGVLQVSSNVGVVKIAEALGAEAHFETLRAFGFGSRTGDRFPGEGAGLLRDWRQWRPVDHATIAFGQGVSVTPIQLVAAVGALANQGEWLRPRLVAARREPGDDWRPSGIDGARRAVSPGIATTLLGMMEAVLADGGTGTRAALPGIRIAGKTGTAQKLEADGRYSQTRYQAWFVGVAPAEAPRLVTLVMLDEPRRPGHTGGAAAAPLYARVAEPQLLHLGIDIPAPTTDTPEVRVAAAPPANTTPLPSVESFGGRILVPDFRGLTVDQVRTVTAGKTLRVEVRGEGRAVSQEPEPGAILSDTSNRVRVEFEAAGVVEGRG